jgi:hypothetical protein
MLFSPEMIRQAPTLCTLEDPLLSTLTQAQHERYLKLIEMVSSLVFTLKTWTALLLVTI